MGHQSDLYRWRGELRHLMARYDDGAIPPGIYAVVKRLERDISWAEQAIAQGKQEFVL
jgi:hypothetical protein